jgi:hypothetical protein
MLSRDLVPQAAGLLGLWFINSPLEASVEDIFDLVIEARVHGRQVFWYTADEFQDEKLKHGAVVVAEASDYAIATRSKLREDIRLELLRQLNL